MNISPLLQVQGEHYSDIALSPTPLAAILQLLKAAAGDTNHAASFSQVWKIRSFELGDELGSTRDISLVCQGRVRLLGYDVRCGREVSTQLLLPGETFGGDKLFFPNAFGYRAIAAVPGTIAFVGIPDLQVWLQQIPTLQSYLQQAVETRQGLIFFKTMTEFHSSTSHALQKILPHLMKMEIKAGESLQAINPANRGRFWLMDGRVCTGSTEAPAPEVGESWGYPDATADAWSAETDSVVYQLPAEYWESIRLLVLPSIEERVNDDSLEDGANSRLPPPDPIYDVHNTGLISSDTPELSPLQEEKLEQIHLPPLAKGRTRVGFFQNNDATRLTKPYPFIRQQSTSDCGVACLAMVCMYWEERFANAIKARFQGQRIANNLQLISSTIAHLGTTVLLWCAATLVMQEQLSIGQFVAFNMLVSSISQPILALFELRSPYQEVLVSMERLNDVLEAEPETNPQQSLEILPKIRGEVHFENVTFSYHPEAGDALQNISFRIQPGQKLGIIGASGAGKTTLVNLLAGLYRPNSGRILIDGRDITEVTTQSLRSQLAIVPQESFIFSATIWENITLFNPEFSQEDAIASAKLAGVHNFIHSLPLGYNTQIGGKARMLSGGQKQGIALARALIRNPPILVLDEATTEYLPSPDMATENQVQQNLSHLRSQQTTFIITHKLNLLQNCDRILVLNRGIAVEQGTHQDLMDNNRLYSHLIQQHTQRE
ncbi:MAG: ATP-binding cassette domain-containing protein [Methylacidiphilales bacterium]|nr:ATP-binding cassette domain-containing protein [Candidatus Methylacidiphilales bacterium]